MAIEKLVPQYLNKDEDERLVKPFEMTDALNIRVSHEDDGQQGVVKNVEGNTAIAARTVPDNIPTSGTNRVIGCVSSDAEKSIYFFLYNSSGNHGIYLYDSSDDTYRKVYEDTVLNFSQNGFVKADIVVNQFQEHLLYFTDNRNEPRKINATKAVLGQYSSTFTGGTDQAKSKFLTVAKAPPQDVITFAYQTNQNLGVNNLKESCFQFAYQYVYDDGEVSALSAYSSLAVSKSHTAFNSREFGSLEKRNNELKITITNSDGPVEKIRLFGRKNNEGAFVLIKELDNVEPVSIGTLTQDFIFRNDGAYTFLSDEEVNKSFDAVPRRAGAQCVSDGRLIYGNYLEGFDNIETDVYNYPVYNPESSLGGDYDFTVDDNDAIVRSNNAFYSSFGGSYNTDFAEAFFAPLNGTSSASPAELDFAANHLDGLSFTDPDNTSDTSFTTTGIHFDVDLSEFPEGGFPEDMSPSIDFNVNLSTSKIGIMCSGDNDSAINVPASTFQNGQLVHSQNCTILHPDNTNGALSNFAPNSDIIFNKQFNVSGVTNLDDFRNALIDGVVGQTTAFVGVSPGQTSGSQAGDAYGNNLSSNDNNAGQFGRMTTHMAAVGGANHDLIPSNVNNKNQLFVAFAGELKFVIHSSSVISPTKVRFFVRMAGVDLSSQFVKGVEKGFGSTQTGNQFVDTSNHSLVAENYSGYDVYDIDEHSVIINSTHINADGFTVEDYDNGSSSIKSLLFDYDAVGNVDVFGESDKVQSFKAGATHDFGVVYYDERNRASGVQRIDTVDVAHFGTSQRQGRNGPTAIDMRILHEPPEWASKWAPVYSKNTSYDKVMQVSIAEACLGKQTTFSDILSPQNALADRDRPVIESIAGGINGQIFVSMRPTEGKANSYKEFKGGQLDYQYQEGDVMRIIEYVGPDGSRIRPLHEFAITSYKYYVDDDKNPIKLAVQSTSGDGGSAQSDENNFRRTGWFLTVRDNNTPRFSRDEVAVGTDFFSQGCVVEIYRPQKQQENRIYYEIGRCYDVKTIGGNRTHGGDRSNTSSPDFSITVEGELSFISSQRLYNGDRVNTGDNADGDAVSSTGRVFVESVKPEGNGLFVYGVHPSNPFSSDTIGTTASSNNVDATVGSGNSVFPGVITLREGDVYMRIREQLFNPESLFEPVSGTTRIFDPTKVDEARYRKQIVESESVSDFFDSKAVNVGRPFVETVEQKEITRESAVTYSDRFVSDSSRLNLSSFNPALFPFKDYNSQHGIITYLVDAGESFFNLQENKVSLTPVGRTLIQSTGQSQLVTSTDVLGKETYMSGTYGPGRNPESVVERFGRIYFSDMSSGKVIAVTSSGISPISDTKMESFFETAFMNAFESTSTPRLPSGIDPENSEFIVTIESTDVAPLGFGGTTIGDIVKPPTNPDVASADGRVSIVASTNTLTWDKDEYPWDSAHIDGDDMEPIWNTTHVGVAYADLLMKRGSVFVDPIHVDKGDKVSVDVVLSTSGEFRGTAELSCKDGSIKFCTKIIDIGGDVASDASDIVAVGSAVTNNGETIAYSTTKEFWMSRYSFIPEMYAHIHNRFFSFEGGQMYRHNTNATRNNFYGNQFNSTIDVISKQTPSMVKAYTAMSLEGNDTWSGTIENNTQNTAITEAMFEEKEGMYYTNIPRGLAANASDSIGTERIVLGVVASQANSNKEITFTSRISNLPFGIGDTVKTLTGSAEGNTTKTIQSVKDRKTIVVDSDPGNLVGSTLMALSSDVINGEVLRDYYAKFKLVNDNTSAIELYGINAVYAVSPLDNSQNQ